MQIPEDKKITVIFRIEPGCLGPKGPEHVDKFCDSANNKLATLHPEFVNWQVVPRHDKTLPELDYALRQRPLSREHASRYFAHFQMDIDAFEMSVFDDLPEMIDQFFGR